MKLHCLREPRHGNILRRPALALLLAIVAGGPANAAEDDSISREAGTYMGIFIGSGQADNRLADRDGFASWGNPGTVTRHEDSGFIGGVMIGKRFDFGGVSFRIELDGAIGDMETETNQLDPEGLDETAVTEFQWITTARIGIEKSIGSATVFATGGLARAGIENFVTDIDFGTNRPATVDPDDSFHSRSTETGWAFGAGVEFPVVDDWILRLEALRLDFGRNDYHVNRSHNNTCGPGGPRRSCLYEVENKLDAFRLGVTHRLGW